VQRCCIADLPAIRRLCGLLLKKVPKIVRHPLVVLFYEKADVADRDQLSPVVHLRLGLTAAPVLVGTHRHPERIVKLSRNRICWLIDIFIVQHFVFLWSTARERDPHSFKLKANGLGRIKFKDSRRGAPVAEQLAVA